MSKKLVAYFSASDATAEVARALACAAGAETYEIRPEVPYTSADLDWTNRSSRSSTEFNDPAYRPAMVKDGFDPAGYDLILLGFPIWWFAAPPIIKTFLEGYDFTGKTIVLFATSGGSGLGDCDKELQPLCPGAHVVNGRKINAGTPAEELAAWVESLNA